ncbi:MAG: DMT family transporter [Halodesulfurarchaeum sp.]
MAAIVVAIAAVSTSAILIRLSHAPSIVKAFYRALFMSLFVLPFAFEYRGEFREISGRDWGFALLSGLALALHFAVWFESLEWTSVAASVTLVQTQPIFVVVAAWMLLEEELNARLVAGILVSLLGSVVMSGSGLLGVGAVGKDPFLGNLLALAGAVMAAGYVLAGRSLRQRLSLFPYVIVVYSVSAVVLGGIVAIQGHPFLGYPPREWVLFVAMALGPGIVGHTVINWALKYVESSVVSVSLLGEPVGSTLLALIIFEEVPGLFTVVGGVVVLVGIFVTSRARST